MSYLLNISTAVPPYKIENTDLPDFYANAVNASDPERFKQKITLLNRKTKIAERYSCLPDFKGKEQELFRDGNYLPSIEKRMAVYKEKIVPLACEAIDSLLHESEIDVKDITHLITVSCTGLLAPGLEFLVAEKYNIQHIEKTSINFLGCYAAIKAIKHAHYIAQTDAQACILIVCAELCSLHFHPSEVDEDIISNLLFADGASAVLMCGDNSALLERKKALKIDQLGSAFIPDTEHFMTWNLGSSAFKMHLSSAVVDSIKENIAQVADTFLGAGRSDTDYWAIHPGGVKIVEAVQQGLHLSEKNVEDSLAVLNHYGNMSSPTVLFVLKRIFDAIKQNDAVDPKQIVACAFGPGLTVELLHLSSVDTRVSARVHYAFQEHVTEL